MNNACSTVELVILGFLLEAPRSAYDLAGLVESRNANRMVKISAPAIYKTCKRLHAAGLLSKKVAQHADRPEKTIYTVNAKGSERFRELMDHYSSTFTPFYLDFNAFLYHIDKLDAVTGAAMLANLRESLVKFNEWLAHHQKTEASRLPFAQKAIVDEYVMLFAALMKWSSQIVRQYEENSKQKKR